MKKWIEAARAFAITGSILPAILGSLFAYYETGRLNLLIMALTAVGVGITHIGANFINDYFDHLTGADEINTDGIFPFSGGSRFIQDGRLPAKSIRNAAIICFTLGTAIGTTLFLLSGYWVLIFTFIGLVSCIFYVSPRMNLTNLGLGEAAVGFNLGFLVVMGSYYVQTSSFSFGSFLIAIPVAFTTTLILFVNEFPDYNGDKKADKRNAIVRMGRKKASRVLVVFLILIIVSILANVILGVLPLISLVSMASLPFFIYGSIIVLKNYDYMPDFITGTVSVLNVNVFINLYLSVSLINSGVHPVLFGAALLAVVAYQVKTMFGIYKMRDSQFIKDLRIRFGPRL